MTEPTNPQTVAELKAIYDSLLRHDLTDEQKLEAARIGRISFKSAGAVRRK